MRNKGYRVAPLSRGRIAQVAGAVRKMARGQSANEHYFPIVEFVEEVFCDGFEVCSKEEMGNNHGLSYPDQGIIRIREDVYEGAVRGNGWNRFTIAHEVGHMALHCNVGFARSVSANEELKPFEDSEWQADNFAGELLAPVGLIKNLTPEQISYYCGLSRSAAEVRYRIARAA